MTGRLSHALEGAGGLLVAGAVAVAVAVPPTVAQGTPTERCGALDRPGSADDLGHDDGSAGGTGDPGTVPGDGEKSLDTTCHERERCSAEESKEDNEEPPSPAEDEASTGAERGEDLWTGAADERDADDQARARGDGPSVGGPPCPDSGGPRQSGGESDSGDHVLETRTARASDTSNGAADGSDRKSSESGGSDGERSADSGRSPATAQNTDGERSSAGSMSESRRSGAGQYEPEDPPEAGGGSSSGSGSGDGSSSGSGSGDDNFGGDLPDTGLAAAALGVTGLVLLLVGALGRRRLPVRGDD